jgi:SAM-dependent methyltransferase
MSISSTISNSFLNIIYALNDSEISVDFFSKYFTFSGMKPWKFGYSGYKRKTISKYIENNIFNLSDWPSNYGYRIDERVVELPWLFSKLTCNPETLFDAGSVLNHLYILRNDKLINKKITILTLAPEKRNYYSLHSGISYVFDDLRACPFKDKFFDTIISLSTIEHIGLDNEVFTGNKDDQKTPGDYIEAVLEFYRLLKPGGKLYLSFPFGKKANHGWFQVFDKEMVEKLLDTFKPKTYEALFFRYFSDGWHLASIDECDDAITYDFSVSKNYEDDYVAFSRAVCCLELCK